MIYHPAGHPNGYPKAMSYAPSLAAPRASGVQRFAMPAPQVSAVPQPRGQGPTIAKAAPMPSSHQSQHQPHSYIPAQVVPQEKSPDLAGPMAASNSQASFQPKKVPSGNSPVTQARISRASPPRAAGKVTSPGPAAASGSPQKDQHAMILGLPTPARRAFVEESRLWSAECSMALCREAEWPRFAGRAKLLDRNAITSIRDAVDSLNKRLVCCPEECCVIFSTSEHYYYLLFRKGHREQALSRMGVGAEDQTSPIPGAGGNTVIFGAGGTGTAPPSAEVSRQNSYAAPAGYPAFAHGYQEGDSRFSARRAVSPIQGRPPRPTQVQSYMPLAVGGDGSGAAPRYNSPAPRPSVRASAAQSFQPALKQERTSPGPSRPLPAHRWTQAPLVPAKPEKPAHNPGYRLSTPRETLERDLTEPEKVRYRDLDFVERLGQGEFGEVFRGRYRSEQVAIKQLFFDENMTEMVIQDLAREIESFRHLNHKRLVRFIGACLEMPHLCLITEYMPGGSLHHLLHVRRTLLPFHHAVNMCLQIADGVMYLHAQNPTIVHRDLKSLNVVLDLSLNIKICDFGLTESMERTHITKKNNGGSPRYMAPELFDCKTKITEKIDVWAMGCIFVEICGGPLPYENITSLADLTKEMLVHRQTPEVPTFIHEEMRKVCISCLKFDYPQRPNARLAYEMLKVAKRNMRECGDL
eukprot:TRINITY_DN6335_c0_g2_i1.p1 TRINITY_DN6335_c0_g2~~TRINITY_DN6335_c0_g2_i1.p1  ORF type:complete len:693 (-),score=101.25 TRINITY_DN6335_c0_g2_i1:65-2143(-)